MTAPHSLTLTWQPGTMNQVRFMHLDRRFTVFLHHGQRAHVHSLDALYLRGKVTLPITAEHLQLLMTQAIQTLPVAPEPEGDRPCPPAHL